MHNIVCCFMDIFNIVKVVEGRGQHEAKADSERYQHSISSKSKTDL